MAKWNVAVRRNERLKSFAGMGYNLGAALLAAVAARVNTMAYVDVYAAGWTVGAGVLILSGHGLLGLLEDDEV